MFCKNCGVSIDENSKFCSACGASVEQEVQNVQVTPVPCEAFVDVNARLQELQGEILKWGIMGLAFACSFIVSFLGIIFSKKALNLSEEYIRLNGEITGKARVGRHLAKGGFFGGIGMTALFGLYVFIMIIYFILVVLLLAGM